MPVTRLGDRCIRCKLEGICPAKPAESDGLCRAHQMRAQMFHEPQFHNFEVLSRHAFDAAVSEWING